MGAMTADAIDPPSLWFAGLGVALGAAFVAVCVEAVRARRWRVGQLVRGRVTVPSDKADVPWNPDALHVQRVVRGWRFLTGAAGMAWAGWLVGGVAAGSISPSAAAGIAGGILTAAWFACLRARAGGQNGRAPAGSALAARVGHLGEALSSWGLGAAGRPSEDGALRDVTLAEFVSIVVGTAQRGAVAEKLVRPLVRLARLDRVLIKEIMVPAPRVVAIDERATLDEVLKLVEEERFSRYPVYRGSIDKVVGVLIVKDLLPHLRRCLLGRRPAEFRVLDFAIEPLAFPETVDALALLGHFREAHQHMAIVVDEFGTTAGVVTLEDVLEAVFGNIRDESDLEEEDAVAPNEGGDGGYVVDGQVSVHDLATEIGFPVPRRRDYETVGGLVMHLARGVPAAGASFTWCGWRLKVLEADATRVSRVRLVPPNPAHPTAERENCAA